MYRPVPRVQLQWKLLQVIQQSRKQPKERPENTIEKSEQSTEANQQNATLVGRQFRFEF